MNTGFYLKASSLLFGFCLLTACNIFPNAKTDDTESKDKVQVVQESPKGKDVQVWFAKTKDKELEVFSVTRPIRGDNRLNATVEELLRGPTPEEEKEGLLSEIPKGTILLGINQKDDTIEIDLSKRFSTGSVSSMQTRLDQFTKTVSPLAEEKKIYLNVEGKRLDASEFDGLEIKQPIN